MDKGVRLNAPYGIFAREINEFYYHWSSARWRLCGKSPSALTAIAKAAGPITGLNCIENYDAAIFFPMKSLLAEAHQKGLLPAYAVVLANAPDTRCGLFPVSRWCLDCRVLVLRLQQSAPGDYGAFRALHQSRRALRLRHSFRNHVRTAARAIASGAGLARRPMCLAAMRRTSAHVLEWIEGGQAIAVLGTAR